MCVCVYVCMCVCMYISVTVVVLGKTLNRTHKNTRPFKHAHVHCSHTPFLRKISFFVEYENDCHASASVKVLLDSDMYDYCQKQTDSLCPSKTNRLALRCENKQTRFALLPPPLEHPPKPWPPPPSPPPSRRRRHNGRRRRGVRRRQCARRRRVQCRMSGRDCPHGQSPKP